MLPVVGAVPEPFPTEPTNKGSLPRVGPVVVLQVSPTVERLGTEHTRKLPHVFSARQEVSCKAEH